MGKRTNPWRAGISPSMSATRLCAGGHRQRWPPPRADAHREPGTAKSLASPTPLRRHQRHSGLRPSRAKPPALSGGAHHLRLELLPPPRRGPSQRPWFPPRPPAPCARSAAPLRGDPTPPARDPRIPHLHPLLEADRPSPDLGEVVLPPALLHLVALHPPQPDRGRQRDVPPPSSAASLRHRPVVTTWSQESASSSCPRARGRSAARLPGGRRAPGGRGQAPGHVFPGAARRHDQVRQTK